MSFSECTTSFLPLGQGQRGVVPEDFEFFGNYKYRGASCWSGLPFVLRKNCELIFVFGLDHADANIVVCLSTVHYPACHVKVKSSERLTY